MRRINKRKNIIIRVIEVIMIGIIKFYKWCISPLLRPCCRYTPTCSEYALEAIKKYGPFKGGRLSIKRILSCNPWGGSGYDPVP